MAELTYHDPDEVGGPDDVDFPNHAHHFQVRGELTDLVELDVLTNDQADELYEEWRSDRNE